MSPATLLSWRTRLGLNKTEAAKALGLSRNGYDYYETGRYRIPLYIALACAAVAHADCPPFNHSMRAIMFPNIKPEPLPQWRIDEAISEKRIAIAELEAKLAELKQKLAYLESLKQS